MTVARMLAIAGGIFILREIAFKAGDAISSNISYNIDHVKVRYSINDIAHLYLDITMTIINDNPAGGMADNFTGSLYYSNLKLGDFQLSQPFILPANSQSPLFITAKVPISTLPLDIYSLVTSGNLLGQVRVKGTLYTSYVNIPIDQNVPII